ncbi:MAG TPA: fasciclin domain-containing protein [Balneolaceae bacterium]
MLSITQTHSNPKFIFAAIIAISLLFTACGDDGGNGNGERNPTITSIQPQNGPPGTAVTISGSEFSPTASENTVTFAGTEAEVTEAAESELVAIVPENAESGAVAVTVDGNTATGPNFTVEANAPGISNVSPDSGAVGTEVTITGMNFSATPEENTITFNGTEAQINSASETELVTVVPGGATDGPIEVTVNGETTTGPNFNVVVAENPPTISSVEPLSGSVGTEVTITGENFSATPEENIVTFGGVEATINSATETELVVVVPDGANSGPVEVTVDGIMATGPDFEVTVDNMMQAIAADGDLSRFTELIRGTQLETDLQGAGPFTVLAPMNGALNNLPAGFFEGLTAAERSEVLSYYVIQGDMSLAELEATGEIETLYGEPIFSIDTGTFNNKFSIVDSSNTDAPNGQIHKITQPLLPDAYLDVFDITYKRPVTNKFACHCISDRTNLDEVLHNENNQYTVFAPSTEAFNNRTVPVDSLSDAELQNLMNYHIIEGQALTSSELTDGQVLATRNGEQITVSVAADGTISLSNGAGGAGATVIIEDIQGTNGIVYVIDNVLEVPSGGGGTGS